MQSFSIGVGNIISAKWHQFSLTRDHMDATSLQSFQVDSPGILKRHTGNGEIMSFCSLQESLQGAFFLLLQEFRVRLDVFRFLGDKLAHMLCWLPYIRRRWLWFENGSGDQLVIFAQNKESRKAAMP